MDNNILLLLLGIGLLAMSRNKWDIPKRGEKYRNIIERTEQEYNLPDKLLARVAYQESRFRDDIIKGDVVSSAGAKGIMQDICRAPELCRYQR